MVCGIDGGGEGEVEDVAYMKIQSQLAIHSSLMGGLKPIGGDGNADSFRERIVDFHVDPLWSTDPDVLSLALTCPHTCHDLSTSRHHTENKVALFAGVQLEKA